jgi:hypothetical protein
MAVTPVAGSFQAHRRCSDDANSGMYLDRSRHHAGVERSEDRGAEEASGVLRRHDPGVGAIERAVIVDVGCLTPIPIAVPMRTRVAEFA